MDRISGQLAAKNRRLAVRAKFFEALSDFQSELRPDAAPQVVLQAIAQTAVGVLGVRSVAAFSLSFSFWSSLRPWPVRSVKMSAW